MYVALVFSSCWVFSYIAILMWMTARTGLFPEKYRKKYSRKAYVFALAMEAEGIFSFAIISLGVIFNLNGWIVLAVWVAFVVLFVWVFSRFVRTEVRRGKLVE